MEESVSYTCPKCGTRCEDELDQWPHPNIYAETINESVDSIEGTLICPKCGNEINYSISEDMNGDVFCIPCDLIIN